MVWSYFLFAYIAFCISFPVKLCLMEFYCVFLGQVFWDFLVTMSRPMLLVFLLLILIITSQFEWKQQLVIDLDPSSSISQKQQQISQREEAVKEKVMLLLISVLFFSVNLLFKLLSCMNFFLSLKNEIGRFSIILYICVH